MFHITSLSSLVVVIKLITPSNQIDPSVITLVTRFDGLKGTLKQAKQGWVLSSLPALNAKLGSTGHCGWRGLVPSS